MTLADELRDILARDDITALRLFVREHQRIILAGLAIADAMIGSAASEGAKAYMIEAMKERP